MKIIPCFLSGGHWHEPVVHSYLHEGLTQCYKCGQYRYEGKRFKPLRERVLIFVFFSVQCDISKARQDFSKSYPFIVPGFAGFWSFLSRWHKDGTAWRYVVEPNKNALLPYLKAVHRKLIHNTSKIILKIQGVLREKSKKY